MSKVVRYLNHKYQLFTQSQFLYFQEQLAWRHLEETPDLIGWRVA